MRYVILNKVSHIGSGKVREIPVIASRNFAEDPRLSSREGAIEEFKARMGDSSLIEGWKIIPFTIEGTNLCFEIEKAEDYDPAGDRLRAAEEAYAAAEKLTDEGDDDLWEEACKALSKARQEVLRQRGIDRAIIGTGECSKSPIHRCVYPQDRSDGWYVCEFCGQPKTETTAPPIAASAENKLKAAEKALTAAEKAWEDAKDALYDARIDVLRQHGMDDDVDISHTWECPKSPIGVCVYTHDEWCEFCGDPEERK